MKRSLIIFALLCSTAGLGAWRLSVTQHKAAVVVTIVRPVVGSLQTSVTATGTLYPSHSVDIKYDGQEIVQKLTVKEGDHVSAGQILAVMDTRVLDHARLQNLQTAEKDMASLIQAEAAFRREEALFKEGIVARADFDVTRATYESLVHQRKADEEAVKEVAQQMDLAVLRSPMNGTVVSIYVHAGEMLGSATAVAALGPNTSISKPTNVLMTIVEDGPLEVYAGVNAADLAGLEPGQDAEISIDAFQPRIFHGRVRRISLEPVVVNNVTTYQAVVTMTDDDPRFRIGLPADVMLLKNVATPAEIIPAKAVLPQSSGNAVCALEVDGVFMDGQPMRGRPVITPVAIAGRTEDAIALATSLPPNIWVANDPGVCRQQREAKTILESVPFDPAPSFSNASIAKSKQGQAIPNLPPPKPKGWLQNLLGL